MVASIGADEVSRFDRGRFQGALLAQGTAREALLTLYAFNLEIARLREKVQEPGLAAIRLQWWREELKRLENGAGEPSHPLVKELTVLHQKSALNVALLHALLEARQADWSSRPFADRKALSAYADATSGGLNRVALSLLGVDDPSVLEAGRLLGRAWTMTGLIRAVPFHWGMGRVCLPMDELAREELCIDRMAAMEKCPALRRCVLDLALEAEKLVKEARLSRGKAHKKARPVLFQAVQIDRVLRLIRQVDGDPFDPRLADAGLPVVGFLKCRLFGFW